jgi:hypothetical protein
LVNRREEKIEYKRRDEKECAKGVVYIGCVLDIALKERLLEYFILYTKWYI